MDNMENNCEMIWKIWKKSKSNNVRYGQCGRKASWIVKWYGNYGRKLWNDMENMEEK
jgi:hypothetical protein